MVGISWNDDVNICPLQFAAPRPESAVTGSWDNRNSLIASGAHELRRLAFDVVTKSVLVQSTIVS
jgi:hypothetical protein